MRVTLGSAPDSWGVWFADDPKQTPWPRFLDEIAEAGYEWTELGPYGYLPQDPDTLRAELAKRGLSVSGTFVMFDFEAEDAWAQRGDEVRRTCELLAELGAGFLILIDDTYSNPWTGEMRLPRELDDAAWARLLETAGSVADVAVEHGLRPVFHPHAETHVEYEPQIERFLAEVDPRVELCVDVGHHAYRGGDPVAFIRSHGDRIGYLHLKSVDPELRRKVEEERIPFAHAVAMDMFVEPQAGAVDFPAVRECATRSRRSATRASASSSRTCTRARRRSRCRSRSGRARTSKSCSADRPPAVDTVRGGVV
jgi:inosose dehydratase